MLFRLGNSSHETVCTTSQGQHRDRGVAQSAITPTKPTLEHGYASYRDWFQRKTHVAPVCVSLAVYCDVASLKSFVWEFHVHNVSCLYKQRGIAP